jgi:DNA-binding transcriptional ArsR family regulator
MSELPLRLKIYRLLVEGYAKERIAQILKKPKSLIHYHVKKLEEEGIVKRVPGSKSPILYTRGINYLKAEEQLKKYGENTDHQGWLVVQASPRVRYHRIGYRFKVQSPPSRTPPWQKQWQASGVQYSEMVITLENGGKWDKNIRIREIKGKNSSIVIWLPEYVCNSKEELEQAVKLKESQAIKVANWLQKHFGYRLGIIEEYQEPHFAIPIPKHVAEAAVRAGIRTEKVWIDVSGGEGDLETNDEEMAITLMSLPEITANLAKKADSQEKRMLMLETALRNIVEFAIHQTKIIDALQQMLANAKVSVGSADELLNHKPKPDDRRDVV